MFKVRHWIGVVSAPILLVSAGCSIYQRPYASNRGLSPERMMALAKTFERQGHLPQAKSAYFQVLATQPGYPDAQQSLDNLIAKEMRQHQMMFGNPGGQPNQLIAQSRQSQSTETRLTSDLQHSRRSASNTVRRESEGSSPIPPTVSLSSTPTPPIVPLVPAQPAAQQLPVLEQAIVAVPELIVEQVPVVELSPVVQQPAIIEQPTAIGQLIVVEQLPDLELSTVAEPPTGIEELSIPEQAQAVAKSPLVDQLPIISTAPVVQQVPVVSTTREIDISVVAEPLAVSAPQSPQPAEVSIPTETNSPDVLVSEAEFLPPVKSADATKPWVEKRNESNPSDESAIDLRQIANAELHPFFGSFHVGIVKDLKAYREKLQAPLAALAADHAVQNNVRARAIFLLGVIGPEAAEAVPILRHEMHNDLDMYVRIDLSEAILKIQPEDIDAINVLIECLKQADQNLRWAAVFSLRNAVSPRTAFVIDRLRELLPTDDLKLQRMVFLTLAEFGPAAAKAIPELEAALDSPDPATREVAKASLACIAPTRKTAARSKTKSTQTELTFTN